MVKKNENPYLNPDFIKQLENSLPPNHPGNESTYLTQLQSFAFPILMWFFDSDRNLGQGRTYLMAAVLIELAKRGKEVYVEDCSIFPKMGSHPRLTKNIINVIFDQINQYHKNDIFEYQQNTKILIYKGRRPK